MAKRVTDAERQRIIDELGPNVSTKSCRQLAEEFGRSPGTISAIAKDVGHEFGRSNLIAAQEAKAKYDEHRRQELRLTTVDKAERILAQMFEESLAFNFGGRDNTYNEHMLPKPTYRDQRDIAQTYKTLMSVVFEYDKQDQGSSDLGLIDIVFGRIRNEADEYSGGNTKADD